jgi:hypothetical protein
MLVLIIVGEINPKLVLHCVCTSWRWPVSVCCCQKLWLIFMKIVLQFLVSWHICFSFWTCSCFNKFYIFQATYFFCTTIICCPLDNMFMFASSPSILTSSWFQIISLDRPVNNQRFLQANLSTKKVSYLIYRCCEKQVDHTLLFFLNNGRDFLLDITSICGAHMLSAVTWKWDWVELLF